VSHLGFIALEPLRGDHERCLRAHGVTRDPLVPRDALLEPIEHLILGDRDDRRRTGLQAVADLPQVLVLEALMPRPATSVSMWPASDTSAREPVAKPTATSTTV
jgi:hypothetical protein